MRLPSGYVAQRVSPKMGLSGLRNISRKNGQQVRAVTTSLILSIGSLRVVALLRQSGKRQVTERALLKAVFGQHAFIGKLIFVRFRSPFNSFLPISLIIYPPIDLILSTCLWSAQIFPPSQEPWGCLKAWAIGLGSNAETESMMDLTDSFCLRGGRVSALGRTSLDWNNSVNQDIQFQSVYSLHLAQKSARRSCSRSLIALAVLICASLLTRGICSIFYTSRQAPLLQRAYIMQISFPGLYYIFQLANRRYRTPRHSTSTVETQKSLLKSICTEKGLSRLYQRDLPSKLIPIITKAAS